ncbi:hypothetical protein C0Q70_04896 [Pomacea canaliculata]|uniref:Sulfatase N-terminal domain-containing protein n=1 Tax=Pomacea canaliculata TaxID=400727 RepID=A0A2T7PJP9_POMCA|nr:hypothetical protein C0Q70_04896 [Pomacea canaliculata]
MVVGSRVPDDDVDVKDGCRCPCWNDVGWREPKMHTPNLNFLALNGIILNNSYVQPLCSPSRSAFMSGYFPFHTGLQHDVIGPMQQAYLPANLTTLPEALKKVGYATHAVGKWHLGYCNWKYTPTYRGFDSFMGYYNAAEDYYTHKLGPGLDLRIDENVDTEDTGKYSAYFYAARAQQIIAAHNASQPLFLYLPFQSVHEPLENGGPVWAAGNNWPLRGAKSTLWEGGTRGTGFVYSRNLFKQTGIIHDGLMHAVDWFPTIMSLVGGQTPPGIDGVSQWESILNGSPSPRYDFVYNIDQILQNSAIRNGDWKLIQGSPGTWNDWYPVPGVDKDPEERNDVKSLYPDVLVAMQLRLAQWLNTEVPPNFPGPDPAANPASHQITTQPNNNIRTIDVEETVAVRPGYEIFLLRHNISKLRGWVPPALIAWRPLDQFPVAHPVARAKVIHVTKTSARRTATSLPHHTPAHAHEHVPKTARTRPPTMSLLWVDGG